MSDGETPAASVTSLRELAVILFRRRYWLLVPTILGTLAAVAAALIMTPEYRSVATVLIDKQQVPTSLVGALNDDANERVAKIRQQIVSRDNLAALMTAHDLYPEERARLPVDDVLATMREAIGVDLVSSEANGNPQAGASTIAFTLSFTYRDPGIARDVTDRLTAMFIQQDKQLRTEQASGTAAFMGRRADELRDQLVELQGKRRTVEAQFAGALPNQVALSAQSGSALRAELSRIDSETQGTVQQNALLAARSEEIAATPNVNGDALRRAEERLSTLRAIYTDDYPDVIAARAAVDEQRAALQAHEDVQAGSQVVAAEIAAGRSRVGMLASRRAEIVAAIASMERMTALAPQATYELNTLERDNDNLQRQYRDSREKQLEAQVAANLQTEDKAERFSIVDAPSLAVEPIGPRRIEMIAAGVLGGAGLGLLLVILWELVAGAVHGESAMIRYLGAPPLVVVPVLRHGDGAGWLAGLRKVFGLAPAPFGHPSGAAR